MTYQLHKTGAPVDILTDSRDECVLLMSMGWTLVRMIGTLQ